MSGFTIVHMDDFERPFPKWALARKSLGLQSFGMNVCELAPGEDDEDLLLVAPRLVVLGDRLPGRQLADVHPERLQAE